MSNILTRLFTVLMLMMFSMGAQADVKVFFGEEGKELAPDKNGTITIAQKEVTGGTILITQEDQKDGTTIVTFKVTPDNGYAMAKEGPEVWAAVPANINSGSTRGVTASIRLDLKSEDFKDIYQKRTYTTTIDSKLGLWVKSAKFTKKDDGSKEEKNNSTVEDLGYSGTYYIAYFGNNKYDPNDPANTNNHYWCPVDCSGSWNNTNWKAWFKYNDDPDYDNYTKTENTGMEFLTTYRFKNDANYNSLNAVWVITKHETIANAYYIQHRASEKYLTLNDYMQGTTGTGQNRLRVHIQSTIAPDNKSVFTIKMSNGYFLICPLSLDGQQWVNVSTDATNNTKLETDANSLVGTTTKTGVSGLNVGGTLGYYNSGDGDHNSKWYLEDYIKRPTIGFDDNDNSKIIITNETMASSGTVYYTTNGDDPTLEASVRTFFTGASATIESFTDNIVIKAVAKVGDEYSNVVTFTAVVHVGSSNQYLIQNLECTDFYMIPGDVSGENITVNTTSLFRPTMSWYFSDAGSVNGVQYYYIINSSTGYYLFRTGGNVYMKTSSDGSDGYKFFIEQGYDADSNPDGFHIVPKGVTDNTYCIYKGGWTGTSTIANASADAMKGSGNARRPEQRHTRWNFVPSNTPLNKTAPFTVTDASTHITKFYKIASVGSSSGYYIVPPTGDNTNATTTNSTTDANVKRGSWYFEKAQEATDADWCTYYYIRNAETGKYLYFTKDGTNYTTAPKACLEMRSTIEEGNEDCYMFTWARTAAEDVNYYIVPKKLKEVSLNNIGSLQRANPIQSVLTRGAGDYAWTFDEVALFCSNPMFEELGENIVISCIPGSAEIRYTTNGEDPSDNGVAYAEYPPDVPFSASDQHIIKAYAVVSDGATPTPNTASSDVITFIKNPSITFTEGNEFPYLGGSAVEPTVSSVTVTPEGGSPITIDDTEYSVAYSNNTDVGEATVTIGDALPENNTIISGTSHFNITPKSLGNGSTAADGITITLTKTGENEYSVTVKNGTIPLIQYDANNPDEPYDYTVSGIPDESGFVATVEAKKEGDEYTGNYTGGAIAVYVKANFPTLTSETDGGSAAAYQATRDLAAPSDLKACIVTGVDYNTGTVAVQELAYIPVGVPVLLLTEGDATHDADFTATIYEVGEGETADVSANKLCKSDGSVTANWGQYYIFTKGEFVLSMGDNKTIKEGKYYFENDKYVSNSTPAPSRLSFARGDTSAIYSAVIQNDRELKSTGWYTLEGQILNRKPTRKGIYLFNGHKIVIK